MFCRTCRGPARDGFARCYQCELARREAGRLLADVVVPVAYAVRGGPLAEDLRRYKSDRADPAETAAAAGRLGAMLATFLQQHGAGVWAAAGMRGGPAAVAVVPSGQGRPGPHPLSRLARSGADLPLVPLAIRPGEFHGRGVNAEWVRVGRRVTGADLLVVDDTWVSGGSAQSVAAALKRAGAGRVAVVVLGRHVNPADPRSETFLRAVSPGAGSLRQRGETMTAVREGDRRAVRLADLHQAGDR